MGYLSDDDDLMQTRPADAALNDHVAEMRREFRDAGAARSNLRYGYVAKGVSR